MANNRLMWFLLVDGKGQAFKGTTASKVRILSNGDVDDFRDALKEKYADSHLKGVAPSDLVVYANKAAFDANTVDVPTNLRSSHSLKEGEGGENEDVGLGADEDHALLVVVPEQDDMNPSYFIEPNVQNNVKNSIFRIVDTSNVNKAIGMGVFFRDNLAVTCRHNLTESQVMVTVRASNDGQEVVIQLRVVYRDTNLDFAILQSNHPRPFIMPWTGNPVNLRGCNLVLASFRIGIDPYQPMYQSEVAFFPASAGALSSDQSHLLYWCATFAGDSGAALIMRGKYLVGIHEEVLNALPEQVKSGNTRSSKKRKIDFARAVTAGGLAQACSALLVHSFVDAFNPSQ
jgi:hypothetical protein